MAPTEKNIWILKLEFKTTVPNYFLLQMLQIYKLNKIQQEFEVLSSSDKSKSENLALSTCT